MDYKLCLLLCVAFAAVSEAILPVPAGCKKVMDEVSGHADKVYKLLLKICCDKAKCKKISMAMARPYVDKACVEIGDWVILNACKAKGIKFPPKWNGNLIKKFAGAVEDLKSLKDHQNLCEIKPKDKVVSDVKSKIMSRVVPEAMGLMGMINDCPKGYGIGTEIMQDKWQGKGKMQGTPDIMKMIHAACDQWCGGSG